MCWQERFYFLANLVGYFRRSPYVKPAVSLLQSVKSIYQNAEN